MKMPIAVSLLLDIAVEPTLLEKMQGNSGAAVLAGVATVLTLVAVLLIVRAVRGRKNKK